MKGKCEMPECENKAEHIHHIDKNRENNFPSNLIAVCHSCHGFFHRDDYDLINDLTKTVKRSKIDLESILVDDYSQKLENGGFFNGLIKEDIYEIVEKMNIMLVGKDSEDKMNEIMLRRQGDV